MRNHCFKQQKENQLVITEKNNEPNQKSTETVFNKNAKMVYSVMVKIPQAIPSIGVDVLVESLQVKLKPYF